MDRAIEPDPEREVELLLARPPRPAGGGRPTPADWMSLLDGALRHGLVERLLAVLPAGRGGLPPAFEARLQREMAGLRIRAALLSAALDEALRALSRHGIPVVPLKGPVLAERLYADPALRPSTDLDLLVADADFDRAAAALEELGYTLDRGWTAAYQRRHHHHVSLHRPRGPAVELHHRAVSGFGTFLPGEDLISRARPFVTATGATALVLSAEDELLYLCLHAAGHLFQRLGWLEDVALLLERHRDLDRGIVTERARTFGGLSALTFALLHLHRCGVDPGPGLALRLGPIRGGMVNWVRRRTLPARNKWVFQGLNLAYHALLCDRPWVAGRYLGHHLVWFVRRRAHRAALRRRSTM
jgi:hypothetical protein